jgi:hypothetical protein
MSSDDHNTETRRDAGPSPRLRRAGPGQDDADSGYPCRPRRRAAILTGLLLAAVATVVVFVYELF